MKANSRKKKPEPSSPSTEKRVLIVDDHPFLRTGLAEVLGKESWLVVVGLCGTAEEALELIPAAAPDVVITDLSLPGRSGLDLVKELAASRPSLPTIVLSMHDEDIYAERSIRAGASGYLMKSEGGEKLLSAIHCVLAGDIHVSPHISASILKSFSGAGATKQHSPLGKLTPREFELFRLFGSGQSTLEIANRLGVSTKTIETHRLHIKSKLGLGSAMELVAYAARWVETGDRSDSGNS